MTTPNSKKVMVAGHICLDITPSFKTGYDQARLDKILSPGKLVNVGQAGLSTGGAVANTGLSMSKIGVEVLCNGKIGNDGFGQIIKKLLGNDMSNSLRQVSGQSSSYSVVIAIPGIDRIFLHHTGSNDTFGYDDIDYNAVTECDIFHFGYPTLMKKMYINDGQELVKIFKKIKELAVVTSLDMTLPDPDSESGKADWRKILTKVLPFVDVFMPSVEEIAYMIDRELFNKKKAQAASQDPVLFYNADDCQALATQLKDLGAAIVAIKCGKNGLFLSNSDSFRLNSLSKLIETESWADKIYWMPSYYTEKVVSATGAGDATIAGFLTSIVCGLSPHKALAVANAMGVQNVTAYDAISGIGDWQTTLAIAEDYNRKQNLLDTGNKGWAYCSELRLYKPEYK